MRYWLPLSLVGVLLAGCGGPTQSDAVRIGERTYRIETPPIPGGAIGPNQRLAQQLCPGGYRVLNTEAHKGIDRGTMDDTDDLYTTTTWVVKCL
jgi:hypothetical protein